MNTTDRSTPAPRLICELERIRLGGVEQWIRIQSNDRSNPVLLLIQQGPGLPMINEASDGRRLWQLEDDFVVVYWDQRGCGKSYNSTILPEMMTLDQMVADASELIQALARRFEVARVYVAGFSLGATVAALAAARNPAFVRAVVCSGPDVRFDLAERVAYAFALGEAERRGSRRALRELRRIGPPPHLDSQTFGARVRWVASFGGVNRRATYNQILRKTLLQLLRSPDYSPMDIARTLRGMRFSQDHLLPDLASLDLARLLPRLDVPAYFLQGRHDVVAPPSALEEFFPTLRAPQGKWLIWFEESAHNPQYEEPAKFRETLLAVKRQHEAASGVRLPMS